MFQGGVEGSPAAAKKPAVKRSQSIVPLCVRQIHSLKGDSEFCLFCFKVQMVCIVGIVKEMEVQSTKIIYKIEDHTGTITAMWWLTGQDSGAESPPLPEAKEGAYVKLFGTVKVQGDEKCIVVLKMFLVEDANVITSHLLEVINTRIQAEKKKNVTQVRKPAGADLLAINSMTFFDEGGRSAGEAPNFTAMQQKVHQLILADRSMNGISISHILSSCPNNKKNDVKDALDFLINEGHVYSTTDSDHFKSTDVLNT